MPVHFLPVEDSPTVRITAAGLGTGTREALRVHLTLDLKSREGQVRSGQVRSGLTWLTAQEQDWGRQDPVQLQPL